ncbi:MAG: quinate 5-dehydrogenase, partial [Clostridia bacterium]|nr:quinate 5-dehydrogenase [Clostridia bacterium]
PTGKSQETSDLRHARFYDQADVIAGDFHFIRRYMPSTLGGKVIITNTVTYEDVELLRKAGVSMLVTTTPELGGRSFGTNVVEAILVSLAGKRPEELSFSDYEEWLEKTGFRPRIVKF